MTEPQDVPLTSTDRRLRLSVLFRGLVLLVSLTQSCAVHATHAQSLASDCLLRRDTCP